jgi:hypothetical protein
VTEGNVPQEKTPHSYFLSKKQRGVRPAFGGLHTGEKEAPAEIRCSTGIASGSLFVEAYQTK